MNAKNPKMSEKKPNGSRNNPKAGYIPNPKIDTANK
jgi:hypothetical protein